MVFVYTKPEEKHIFRRGWQDPEIGKKMTVSACNNAQKGSLLF